MRYFRNRSDRSAHYGIIYRCNHPLYTRCTLFLSGDRGIAVIQQRFNPELKTTWWSNIDEDLVDDIYENPGFQQYLETFGTCKDANGLYYTVEVRKLMWALRMKPLKREFWER